MDEDSRCSHCGQILRDECFVECEGIDCGKRYQLPRPKKENERVKCWCWRNEKGHIIEYHTEGKDIPEIWTNCCETCNHIFGNFQEGNRRFCSDRCAKIWLDW